MHKIFTGIDQKKIVGSIQLLVICYWFLTHKSNEAMQHCFKTQKLLQIAIADYGVVSICYVYAISVAKQ